MRTSTRWPSRAVWPADSSRAATTSPLLHWRPTAARSADRQYASRTAVGRRLASRSERRQARGAPMMTRRVITMIVAGMLAVGAVREATPAAPGDGLVGTTWHTVRIDGDALFFVIRDVGIRFEDQGRFVAAVRFIDGEQTSRTGTYRVVNPGTILLTIEGFGNAK